MDYVIAIAAGIGLAAACGFRVFVPMLVAALAARAGYLAPSSGMAWIGSNVAIALLAVATVVEAVAFYVPWLDHALDVIASPAAVVAGVLTAATAAGNVDPAIRWSVALIAGGGAAGAIQGGSVGVRALSGVTTAGIANPIVSTLETIGSVILAALAIFLPLLALLVAVVLIVIAVRTFRRARQLIFRPRLRLADPLPRQK